jgi:protein-disulfide isomerase
MTENKPESSLKSFYIVLGVVALVGLGAVSYALRGHARGKPVTEPVKVPGASDPAKLAEMAKGITMGDPNAPVTILVFEDYLCPHCAEFTTHIEPDIVEQLIKPGKAKLIFHDFPLRPETGSFLAARAARCANDQGKFWEYQDVLFRTQPTWGTAPDKEPALVRAAEGLGLDKGKFRSCLDSDRHADEVSADLQLARALGLDGTPSVLVGAAGGMDRPLSNYTLPYVKEAVEAAMPGK